MENSMVETRRNQGQQCITGPEAQATAGTQDLPLQSHRNCASSQDARIQDALEAMAKISPHEQSLVPMTLPKEATELSQESGYGNAPDDMVQFGQTSPPSHALATILSTQDTITQDAPEAMLKIEGRTNKSETLWNILQTKAAKLEDPESTIMNDSDTTMQKEGCTKDTDCDMSASKLSEYGANNLLLPPLVEPLQRPSTPVRVSEPMDEAPETPKTGNVIQPLVKNSVPPQVTQLSTFERSRLTLSDPLSTFNPNNR
jgi:hypothetical protein